MPTQTVGIFGKKDGIAEGGIDGRFRVAGAEVILFGGGAKHGRIHDVHQQRACPLGIIGSCRGVRVYQRHEGEELGVGFGGVFGVGALPAILGGNVAVVHVLFGAVNNRQEAIYKEGIVSRGPAAQAGDIGRCNPQAGVGGGGCRGGEGGSQRGGGSRRGRGREGGSKGGGDRGCGSLAGRGGGGTAAGYADEQTKEQEEPKFELFHGCHLNGFWLWMGGLRMGMIGENGREKVTFFTK